MTVRELRKLLETANPDARVMVYSWDDYALSDDENGTIPAEVEIYDDEIVFC
jgi:hypothetical protein